MPRRPADSFNALGRPKSVAGAGTCGCNGMRPIGPAPPGAGTPAAGPLGGTAVRRRTCFWQDHGCGGLSRGQVMDRERPPLRVPVGLCAAAVVNGCPAGQRSSRTTRLWRSPHLGTGSDRASSWPTAARVSAEHDCSRMSMLVAACGSRNVGRRADGRAEQEAGPGRPGACWRTVRYRLDSRLCRIAQPFPASGTPGQLPHGGILQRTSRKTASWPASCPPAPGWEAPMATVEADQAWPAPQFHGSVVLRRLARIPWGFSC